MCAAQLIGKVGDTRKELKQKDEKPGQGGRTRKNKRNCHVQRLDRLERVEGTLCGTGVCVHLASQAGDGRQRPGVRNKDKTKNNSYEAKQNKSGTSLSSSFCQFLYHPSDHQYLNLCLRLT